MTDIPYDALCKESDYLFEMAKMHKLSPKRDVIRRLRWEMKELQTNPQFLPESKDADRNWLILYVSAQIFALAMELTDDLVAVCKAYMTKDEKIIERIANFPRVRGEGHEFYKQASADPSYAGQAMGVDASDSSACEAARKSFEDIRNARSKYDWWKWYTGWKHAQRAIPVVLSGGRWGLYNVPKKLNRRSPDMVHTGNQFIDTVRFVEDFVNLAENCITIWQQVLSNKFRRNFPYA